MRTPGLACALTIVLSACGACNGQVNTPLAIGAPLSDASVPEEGGSKASGEDEPPAGSDDAGIASGSGGIESVASAGCGKRSPTGERVISTTVAGTERTYLLSIPESYADDEPQALYFVFHGYGGGHDDLKGLNFQQDAIAVFPDGLPRDGAPSGWDESPTSTDVALFDAILQQTANDYCIEETRVYATGFSWGGWMATALGCLRGDVVRGIASVEGGVLNDQSDCKGPVAAYINHYTLDPVEPLFAGERSRDFFVGLAMAADPIPYDAPNPCVRYDGSASVVYCVPEGAFHQWPDYATEAIKRFFATL